MFYGIAVKNVLSTLTFNNALTTQKPVTAYTGSYETTYCRSLCSLVE